MINIKGGHRRRDGRVGWREGLGTEGTRGGECRVSTRTGDPKLPVATL